MDAKPDTAATFMAGDELALQMMQTYSKACARFAHEPSQANALAMDTARQALLDHAGQRERSIRAAIDRLVLAARFAGASFAGTGEWREAQQAQKDREQELHTIIGLA
jgi:hypothetical protein